MYQLLPALRTGPSRLRGRLQFAMRPAAAPLLLLLLALATAFLFGNDRGHFYRSDHHDWMTAHHLAVAANLSPDHNFLLFNNRALDTDGSPSYTTYSRFPIGSYVLTKLAMLPFQGDLSAQVYAARILMLLFFAGSAALAYLSLCRLIASRWIALTATLLAFSSYYLLYYNDVVGPDTIPALFGVMLTYHGIVLFVQEGRFLPLLLKAGAALLLCWQVYALLLPFIVLGLISELVKARSPIAAPPPLLWRLKRSGAGLRSNRYLLLGVAALLCGIAILSFNLVNEYFALEGKVPLAELPGVVSLLNRTGANAEWNAVNAAEREWGNFLKAQFFRIGGMGLPFVLNPFDHGRTDVAGDRAVIIGVLMLSAGLFGLIFARQRLLLATLLLFGFCWALPARDFVAYHDTQSVFYIGIPLVCYALLLRYLRELAGRQLIMAFAVAGLFVFALSAVQMARLGHDPHTAAIEADLMDDFAAIRSIVGDKVVYIPAGDTDPDFGGAPLAPSYFLAGSGAIVEYQSSLYAGKGFLNYAEGQRAAADFLVTREHKDGPALLTPDNRRAFLYNRVLYDGQSDPSALGRPIIESDYNVYFRSGRLWYASEECAHPGATFFLHLAPVDPSDLPEHRRKWDFANLDFNFEDNVRRYGNRCVAIVELPPEYDDIAYLRTGQYTAEGRLWEGLVIYRGSGPAEPR